jgi:hypothetical protein
MNETAGRLAEQVKGLAGDYYIYDSKYRNLQYDMRYKYNPKKGPFIVVESEPYGIYCVVGSRRKGGVNVQVVVGGRHCALADLAKSYNEWVAMWEE